MKTYSLILLLSCLLFCSCKKEAANTGVTTISGKFYDVFNTEPYQNIKIKIGEYSRRKGEDGNYSYNLIRYIDSAVTNAGGTYKISFTPQGKGMDHFLNFEIPANVYVRDSDGNIARQSYRSKRIEQIGGTLTYNFDVYKEYYMKTNVIVHDNPYPYLSTSINTDKKAISNANTNIYGANNERIIYIPIIKNTGGFNLYFSVTDPVSNVNYAAPKIFLNPVIDKDTIEGGTYEVYPATFKKVI